nr:YkvA family protein [Bradyrhizobium sp. dw_411]
MLKREIHAIYLAAQSPHVPWYTKYLALAVVGYALSPIDLIPDFIPVLGYLDDLIIVPLGIWLVLSLIPEEVMTASRARVDEAVTGSHGKIAAIIIIAIWIVSGAVLGWCVLAYWRGTR